MRRALLVIGIWVAAVGPRTAAAQEYICDPRSQDCRGPLLQLIQNEQVGIDVAFWFIEDARYVTELIRRHNARVPIRLLLDGRAGNSHGDFHPALVAQLRDAGVPMREKFSGDILHFKMMLFHGQNLVQFSKANYTPFSFVPAQPHVDYFDEAIYFTHDPTLTSSFQRRFDDLWTDTSQYRNFANVAGSLIRRCPTCSIHSSMNFPPLQDFATRAVNRYNAETLAIDAVVFRVTQSLHADAMIRAVKRGVPVRLITEPSEYRNPERVWHAKQIDRMWLGGVQIKHRQHAGLTHQASVVLRGLGEVIFGSSNWTTASARYQDEHNYFYNPSLGKPWVFAWFASQFDRNWSDLTNYVAFQPLPPGNPAYYAPAPGAVGQTSSSVTLQWDGGPWAHLYDVYFGTTPDPPLLVENVELGSPEAGQLEAYTVGYLQPGTTYYWRIVGKTWAQLTNSGPVWSFTTSGVPVPVPGGDPVATYTCQAGSPRPAILDFDGDGCDDIGVWRGVDGIWFALSSSNRFAHAGQRALQWGSKWSGDVPVPADYDGDRRVDVAVWRPGSGQWYILGSRHNYDPAAATVSAWGAGWAPFQDIPVPADYDGDGRADLAVWRPATGQWFIRRSGTGTSWVIGWGSGSHRDVPVPADYDGDGRADPAVWRPGTGTWYVVRSSTSYTSSMQVQWGIGGDRPVPRDYDGNGTTDIAVWRPSNGTWYITTGRVLTVPWGVPGDEPVPADYDGDGRTDLAVWRPHTGVWYVLPATSLFTHSHAFAVQWGAGLPPYSDQPLLRR
jgi:hypothetical protein